VSDTRISVNIVRCAMRGLISLLPLFLLLVLGGWGALLKKKCKFTPVNPPFLPYCKNPGLALELASCSKFVEAILGPKDTEAGKDNRAAAIRFQHYDFVFIPLYVLFFAVTAWMLRGDSPAAVVTMLLAVLTGILDVLEDFAIIALVKEQPGRKPLRFGQLKWLFYFLTLGAEGALFFTCAGLRAPSIEGMIFGAVLILISLAGVAASALSFRPKFSFNPSFRGITITTAVSQVALLGLALAPLLS
jgi:hypothetical protein